MWSPQSNIPISYRRQLPLAVAVFAFAFLQLNVLLKSAINENLPIRRELNVNMTYPLNANWTYLPTHQHENEDQKEEEAETTYVSSPTETKPLNVVLLYADDWSFNSLGLMNDYIQTPVLDRMARENIFFTHSCVVTSICMQSRATLYTGQYSSRHQTYFAYRKPVNMYKTRVWKRTLYPLMVKAGYHVGFFGKYHHLPFPNHIPTFSEHHFMPFSHYVERDGATKHITEWNTIDAMKFLKNKPADKPFFLTVSFFATHAEDGNKEQYRPMNSSMNLYNDGPVPLPKTYTEEHWNAMPYFFKNNRRNFGRARFMHRYSNPDQYQHMMKNTYRMVTEVDSACGKIIDYLNATNQLDNTMIIFTSDNGNMHGQHGLAEKWFAYEESLRVPLIVHDPRVAGGKNHVEDSFTLNIDLAPTILSAAGVTVPKVMQGRDLADLYLRQQAGRKQFLYEYWDNNRDIPNSVALVRKDFKFIFWNDYNYHQVFDMKNDPLEEHDLYNATDRKKLNKTLHKIMKLQRHARKGVAQW